eukprot:scaffold784_cov123-Skeletonema_marinoi.AAC.14
MEPPLLTSCASVNDISMSLTFVFRHSNAALEKHQYLLILSIEASSSSRSGLSIINQELVAPPSMSSSTKDQLPASASEMAAAPPAASNSTPVVAPPTQDAQPKSIALHQKQQEDIQRDLHLTIAPLDEESIVSPELLKPRVNAFQEKQSKSIKPDGSDSTGISRDDAKNGIALIDENQLDCVKQQRVDDICNPSVTAASDTEGALSNKKEVTCSKEEMDAQSGMPLFAASFDFDDSACTPAPSDEGSDVGNTIV